MSHAKPREHSNPSVDQVIVELGACGLVHLPTGRTCVLPARHRGGCEFVPRNELPERAVRQPSAQQVVDQSGEPVEILLVEDEPTHVRLTQEALVGAGLGNALHAVDSGEAALAFLRREPPYGDAPRPGLVLMDVHLPGRTGLDVLGEIKTDPDLLDLPVALLTAGIHDQQVSLAYGLGASCVVTKPVGYAAFVEAVRELGKFWFTTVTRPR